MMEDIIISYYKTLFGDDITIEKVIFDKHLKEICKKTGMNKEQILNVVKKYIVLNKQ